MTVEQLQARLRALHARMGAEGCLSLTLDQDPGAPCYASHWSRPGRYQPEAWRRVGAGALPECLAALERYADDRDRRRAERLDQRRWPAGMVDPAELIAAE